MYHDPCHSPMKRHDPLKVVNALMNSALNGSIEANERCCGESGTLALTRPDVSTQVRFRKEQDVRAGVEQIRESGHQRRGQGADFLPLLPARPGALSGRRRPRSGLHRGRNRPPSARRRLDGRVRAPRELGWHRARPRLGARARRRQKDDTAARARAARAGSSSPPPPVSVAAVTVSVTLVVGELPAAFEQSCCRRTCPKCSA